MLISGERVRQARELKSLTQAALAKAIGVSQAAIAQIESGAFLASDELTEAIAKKTDQPVQFFYQEPAPDFPTGSLLFRSHASMKKREITEASRHAQFAYEIYMALRKRLRELPVVLPSCPSTDAAESARETRKALKLPPTEPVPHLLNVLEWQGVIVVVVPDVKSRDAFSLWFGNHPILALSTGRSGDRGRMSVAHELGHLVMHAGKSRFEIDDTEADDFAAEFLMPASAIGREIKTPVTLASLAAMKPRWRVSIQALIRRAKDLEIITDRQYRYLFEQISSMGWRKAEPVEIVPEQPRALRQMAEMLYGDPIDFRAMAADLARRADTLREVVSQYAPKGLAPAQPANVVSLPRHRLKA